MKYALFFENDNGDVDQLTIEGETIEELRNIAEQEVQLRNPKYYWTAPVEGFEM